MLERSPMGIEDCALYPLFTEELLAIMRTVIRPEKLERIAVAAVIRARRGGTGPHEASPD